MGNCCTSNTATSRPKKVNNDGIMGRFALKLPKIQKTYKKMEDTFEKYSIKEGNEILDLDGFKSCVEDLGVPKERLQCLTPEDIFNSFSKENEAPMCFSKFVSCFAANYVFQKVDGSRMSINSSFHIDEELVEFKVLAEGFLIVRQAFDAVDTDGSGFISFAELKVGLNSSSVAKNRLGDCDLDRNGEIDLDEFVYGFSKWCGVLEKYED